MAQTATGTEPDAYLPWGDPAFQDDPYPWYERLRRADPVHRTDDGLYVLTRYADVMRCLKSPATTVVPGWDAAGPWQINRATMIGADQPDHSRLRRQTNRWFTPKLVRQWVEVTAQETARSLDAIGPDGQIEAWTQLCVRPNHITMTRVLGMPDEGDLELSLGMADAMAALSAVATPEEIERAYAAFEWVGGLVDAAVAAHRVEPGDRLIDALIRAVDDGAMSAEELRGTVALFYGLGHVDNGYLIAAALHRFAVDPELFALYRAEPDSRRAVINELARLYPAELSAFRHVTEDFEIDGVVIPAGAQVRCMLGAANRDPEVFENPDTFDHRRPPEASMHLSFGTGVHHCAGEVLTRAEAEVILGAVAERYEQIDLAAPPAVEHHDFARSYTSLRLRLS